MGTNPFFLSLTHLIFRLTHAAMRGALLGLSRRPVGVVVALICTQMRPSLTVGVQLGDRIHVCEQIAVVADDERRAGEGLKSREKPILRGRIQVIRGLIQQDKLGVRAQKRGEGGSDRLPARKGAKGTHQKVANGVRVGGIRGERRAKTVLGKGCEGAFFNIPGVADGVIKAGGVIARFQGIKRPQNFCNSKNIGKMLMLAQPQILRQVSQTCWGADCAVTRLYLAKNKPEEGSFPGAVIANKPGDRGGKYGGEVGEKRGFTRMRIRNMVECNVWHGPSSFGSVLGSPPAQRALGVRA